VAFRATRYWPKASIPHECFNTARYQPLSCLRSILPKQTTSYKLLQILLYESGGRNRDRHRGNTVSRSPHSFGKRMPFLFQERNNKTNFSHPPLGHNRSASLKENVPPHSLHIESLRFHRRGCVGALPSDVMPTPALS